uniref:Uncharacterized protein n=1 Tax=Arion vulgaris TaxID=1028688 RepID=A0A0B7B0C6_9EUPU
MSTFKPGLLPIAAVVMDTGGWVEVEATTACEKPEGLGAEWVMDDEGGCNTMMDPPAKLTGVALY